MTEVKRIDRIPGFFGRDIAVKGIKLEGKALCVHLIGNSRYLDPVSDLNIAPIDDLMGLPTLANPGSKDASAPLAKIWFTISLTIHYIHGLGYAHGMLTPDKIYWDAIGERIFITGWDKSIHVPNPAELCFCPPEVQTGQNKSTAADIYFLGALLYFTESGEVIHKVKGETYLAKAVRDNHIEPVLANYRNDRTGMGELISTALQSDPQERFRSVKELLDAFEPVQRFRRLQKSLGFWPATAILFIASSVIIAPFLWYLVWKYA